MVKVLYKVWSVHSASGDVIVWMICVIVIVIASDCSLRQMGYEHVSTGIERRAQSNRISSCPSFNLLHVQYKFLVAS